MKKGFLAAAILAVGFVGAQAQKQLQFTMPEGIDRLGNNHHVRVGMLPDKVEARVPAKFAELLSLSIYNQLSGGQRPYGLISKKDLASAMNSIDLFGLERVRRSRMLWGTIPVQQLIRLDIYYYDLHETLDTLRDKQIPTHFEVKKTTWITTVASLTLIDVASSKTLAVQNFMLNGSSDEKSPNSMATDSDSMRAVRAIWVKARNATDDFLTNAVVATGNIEQILVEEKGRAKSVRINDCGFLRCRMNQEANVWSIEKAFPVNGADTIRHFEQVGRIQKIAGFDWAKQNFDVNDGEKDIAQKFAAGVPLIVSQGAIPPVLASPEFGRPTVQIDSFTNRSKLPTKWLPTLRKRCAAGLAQSPSLVDLVDRDAYDYIEQERKLQKKVASDATQQGVTIGSETALTVEVGGFSTSKTINYDWTPAEKEKMAKEKADEEAAKAAEEKKKKEAKEKGIKYVEPPKKPVLLGMIAGGKPPKTVPIEIEVGAAVEATIKLVSITTGEVLYTARLEGKGGDKIPFSRSAGHAEMAGERALSRSLDDLAKDIHLILAPKFATDLRILEVVKKSDDEVKQLLAQGGQRYGFFPNQRFEVVESSEIEVDGKKLTRAEVIGKAKLTDNFLETMQLKVTDGEKAIFQKMATGARLGIRAVDRNAR